MSYIVLISLLSVVLTTISIKFGDIFGQEDTFMRVMLTCFLLMTGLTANMNVDYDSPVVQICNMILIYCIIYLMICMIVCGNPF